jgi:DNA modification methylase
VTVHYGDDWLTVYLGDVRVVLRELEAESVNCVVTSPPYYGLRDYGAEGQIGLEATVDEYVDTMAEVFGEVRRVLRKDGTVWLNLGDSYASTATSSHTGGSFQAERRAYAAGRPRRCNGGVKPKDRMMIPARVALALQADGWWLRDEIVWAKPNPMPSSVADRTTPAHEMLYLLTRSARYAYDADAIREVPVSKEVAVEGALDAARWPSGWATGDDRPPTELEGRYTRKVKVPGGWEVDPGSHSGPHRKGRTAATYREKTVADPNARGLRQAPEPGEPNAFHPLGRNKRSVWTIPTAPYPQAHFATFPPKLVEPCILAGCPPDGVVLDPFAGSGTTGMVANELGRRAVLIDLSAEYLDQAIVRIAESRALGRGPGVDMPVPFAEDGLWGEATA